MCLILHTSDCASFVQTCDVGMIITIVWSLIFGFMLSDRGGVFPRTGESRAGADGMALEKSIRSAPSPLALSGCRGQRDADLGVIFKLAGSFKKSAQRPGGEVQQHHTGHKCIYFIRSHFA